MKRQNAETDRAFRILDICNELLNWILMIILVVLFCYGTYGIGDSYMLEENAMPEHYEIYRPTEEDYGDFDELKAQNSDVCGWITIYGTHVDYPIVQSEDNSTYLMRNPRGEYSLSGSIFMDYMNQKDFSDFNTIIYGHNMRNGSMFGTFRKLHEQSNLTSPYVWICTPKHTWRYKIFSVHTASVTGETYTLFSMADEQFAEYLKSMKSASELQLDAEADKDDKVITMSTCTGNSSTRFVIQAKRLEKGEN